MKSHHDEENAKEQVLVTDELAFKYAMTRDFKNVQDLTISQEGITFIDSGNMTLKSFINLKSLDLSFNEIAKIDNLEVLKELRDLNLSFNKIETIDNLGKFPNLRTVNLNHNKIKRLENLKNCRKLETLSIVGNQIEEFNVYGGLTEPLLELKELLLGKNKIQIIKTALNIFPNVRK